MAISQQSRGSVPRRYDLKSLGDGNLQLFTGIT